MDRGEARERAINAGKICGRELLDRVEVDPDVEDLAAGLDRRWAREAQRPEWSEVFTELSRAEARDAWRRGVWEAVDERD